MLSNPSDPASIILPGTLLEIGGVGVLLTGDSGSGKSDAALGLLDRGHRLIADDAVEFYLHEGRLHGRCPARLVGLLAIRGLGVVDVRELFGPQCLRSHQQVGLEIALEPQPPPADALMVAGSIRSIMNTAVPCLRLPVMGKRDLPLLLEVAAKAHAGISGIKLKPGQTSVLPRLHPKGKEGT